MMVTFLACSNPLYSEISNAYIYFYQPISEYQPYGVLLDLLLRINPSLVNLDKGVLTLSPLYVTRVPSGF